MQYAIEIPAPPLGIPAETPPPSGAPLNPACPLLNHCSAVCLWQWNLGLSKEQERGNALGAPQVLLGPLAYL